MNSRTLIALATIAAIALALSQSACTYTGTVKSTLTYTLPSQQQHDDRQQQQHRLQQQPPPSEFPR